MSTVEISRGGALEDPIEHSVHCLVCAELVVKEEPVVVDVDLSPPGKGQELGQRDVISWEEFVGTFQVLERNQSSAWELDDRSPFCGTCKGQLLLVAEVRGKIRELQAILRDRIQELEKKLAGSESAFQSMPIYAKDLRYHNVRKCILKRILPPRNPSTETLGKTRQSRRKSERLVENNLKTPMEQFPRTSHEREARKSLEAKTKSELISDDTIYATSNIVNEIEEQSSVSRKTKRLTRIKPVEVGVDDQCDSEDKSNVKLHTSPGSQPGKMRRRMNILKEDPPPVSDDKEKITNNGNGNINVEEGRKTTHRVRIDLIAGTCTYRNVTLQRVDSDKYKCNLCSELVPNVVWKLKVHVIQNHTTLTECKECGRRFDSVHHLRGHVKYVHEKIPRSVCRVECPICGKPEIRKPHLRQHLWTHYNQEEKSNAMVSGEPVPHTMIRKYQCDICGHRFSQQCGLDRHKKLHVLDKKQSKPHPDQQQLCPECGKCVKGLDDHIARVHPKSTDFRFICVECNMRFSTSAMLRKHKICHKKPFGCHLCPRTFSRQGNLNQHVNLHLNIRPFQCEHCPSAFADKNLRARHVKTFHSEGSNPKRKSYFRGPERKEFVPKWKVSGDMGGGESL